MKLSVFNPILYSMSFEDAIKYLSSLGVNSVELGCGGYPGTTHINASELLKNNSKIKDVQSILSDNGIDISALSTHGNALHPNREIASAFHQDYENACRLAGKLGVETVVTFSGCPGDCDSSLYPNWVVCPWPEDFLKVLDYQWEKMIAYWKNSSKFALSCGVKKIALEMHPGFCVYNPETLLKLRGAVGDIIGANYDPSHLIWQGIDVVEAIRYLGKSIYHFHAKDTRIDPHNTALNGILDTKHYQDEINRSWIFRTVGYGLDGRVWKGMISMLKTIGYDGAISIEHEDSLMSPKEGLEKAVTYLKDILIYEQKPETIGWA